jgi:maltooligosyltrehalose trehalohydrolase
LKEEGGVGRLGAAPVGDGLVEFRVWAPKATRVTTEAGELEPEGGGVFAARLPAAAGDRYRFSLDGGKPLADPCSRWQPEGLRGPSAVLDTDAFEWGAGRAPAQPPVSETSQRRNVPEQALSAPSAAVEQPSVSETSRRRLRDGGGISVPLPELVIYELHVGAFTPAGTFQAAAARMPELAELGVTAVELMPVATFPGERGWGYDGVLTFAPHRAYGGPQGLAHLVDAAHAAGLAVILDVVYNHIGPGSELVGAYGPYFTDRHDTFWGQAIDYSQPAVREWAIQNAEQWIRDYRIDGLRLDAVHAIFDASTTHVVSELALRLRAIRPDVLVISEIELHNRKPIERWGHDAQWADQFHHALHVLLTGERDGYYEPYGKVADLARAYRDTPAERLVICAQNHDQIGNRAFGDRLPPQVRRLAAACTLFAPQTPLLFMGEEHGEDAPFQFFTDHDDPFIANATREGRRKEFAKFAAFAHKDVPDPQALATFERSKLRPEAGNAELRAFYRELLALRRTLPREVETDVDEKRRVLRVRRGGAELVADFANLTAELRC